MTGNALLLTVHLLDGRYHGAGDWPPAPFRVFQALVAGALTGEPPDTATRLAPAFEWLESLDPPDIAVPPTRPGARNLLWVPNNDLDTVGGDPDRIAALRTGKVVHPRLLEDDTPLAYLWRFDPDQDGAADHAAALVEIALGLYQLGRGVDMAFARAEVLDAGSAEASLGAGGRRRYRPHHHPGGQATELACPQDGSFASLQTRHDMQRQAPDGLKRPPPPHRVMRPYAAVPLRRLYTLARPGPAAAPYPWPPTRAAALCEALRDRLAAILAEHHDPGRVERIVVGRNAGPAEKAQRVRLLPLPSVAHDYADHALRRVLIEVPADCPLPAADIFWAADRIDLGMDLAGAIQDESCPRLVPAETPERERMARRYLNAQGARKWRTVTPAALPARAARKIQGTRKTGPQRAAEETRAAEAVLRAALDHAGIAAPVEAVRVQREPFHPRGARAEAFAEGTRFPKDRFWHVEIVFAAPCPGPLAIGDGRYLGLGLLAPVRASAQSLAVYPLARGTTLPTDKAADVVQAARRAVMALARDDKGHVAPLFSGHEPDGSPARDAEGRHRHVFLTAADTDGDGMLDHLLLAAPWACDHRVEAADEARRRFKQVAEDLQHLRAGALGLIRLDAPLSAEDAPAMLGPATRWTSQTPYIPTRHPKTPAGLHDAVVSDLCRECHRRGLPKPDVAVLRAESGPRGGQPRAWVRLTFATAVPGPILLGRDSHKGGGLFLPEHA